MGLFGIHEWRFRSHNACPYSLHFMDELIRLSRIPCIFGSIDRNNLVCQVKVRLHQTAACSLVQDHCPPNALPIERETDCRCLIPTVSLSLVGGERESRALRREPCTLCLCFNLSRSNDLRSLGSLPLLLRYIPEENQHQQIRCQPDESS